MAKFNENQINFLKEVGFEEKDGIFKLNQNYDSIAVFPCNDGQFKIEFYWIDYDDNDNPYMDSCTKYNDNNLSFEEFINRYIER